MCRCNDIVLNCVSTYIERSPELRQLLIGISTSRYFPPRGTAGLARSFVKGNNRVPAPPPMMMESVRCVVPGGRAGVAIAGKGSAKDSCRCRSCLYTIVLTQHPRFRAIYLRYPV